jgi:hypothetical protein
LQQAAEQMQAKLTELVQSNIACMQELNAMGVRIDPSQVLNMRIDILVQKIAEVLGAQGLTWVLSCNLAFEERMSQVLAQAKAEGTKAVLGAGGTLSPAQIRDLAKQTKTHGG